MELARSKLVNVSGSKRRKAKPSQQSETLWIDTDPRWANFPFLSNYSSTPGFLDPNPCPDPYQGTVPIQKKEMHCNGNIIPNILSAYEKLICLRIYKFVPIHIFP